MPLWDSADLLSLCKLYARRPENDQAMPPASWYSFLSHVQPQAFSDLVTRFPDLAYGPPLLLSTTDGGFTYGFGSDVDGDPIRAMGHAQVFASLPAIPDDPLELDEDFIVEGAILRIPSNRSRQFSAGPYARVALRPDTEISATVAPVLQPKPARMLLVWAALEAWASRPGAGARPGYYAAKYRDELTRVWTDLATAYNRSGGQGAWYTALDLASAGQLNV